MSIEVHLYEAYRVSDSVVARVIEDQVIIVPLVAGIGDTDDELFTVNETGRAVWDRLDGSLTLEEMSSAIASEFDAPVEQIRDDLLGFAGELLERGIIVGR